MCRFIPALSVTDTVSDKRLCTLSQLHQDALRAVDGTRDDDDDKAFLVELLKLAEQAEALTTT